MRQRAKADISDRLAADVFPDRLRARFSNAGSGRGAAFAGGRKLVGIVEVAKFGSIDVRQTALLEAVLPSAARTLKTLSDAERAKEALNSVRVSDEHGRLVLEATAEGIFCVDSKGRINFANRAAHQLLGFQKGAMAGQPSGELLPFIRPTAAKRRTRIAR